MDTISKAFSDFIVELREEKGLTQTELSRLTGISQPVISMYENGVNFPRRKQLESLASALGVTPEEIVAGKRMKAKLPSDEELMLSYYRQLNTRGKQEALKHLNLLVSSGMYEKRSSVQGQVS